MLPIYLCLGKNHKQVCFFAYTPHWLKTRFIFSPALLAPWLVHFQSQQRRLWKINSP